MLLPFPFVLNDHWRISIYQLSIDISYQVQLGAALVSI